MAYYFMIEKKKGNYQEINISNSIYFQTQERKYSKPEAYTLHEIDLFTMMFNNEQELREQLVQEGLISLEHFIKPLSIRCLHNNKYTKVPYDFLYQCDIEYIMNPQYLISIILEKYYQDDLLLIKKIANTFSEFRKCSTTAKEARQFIEMSIRENKRCPHLESTDENGDTLVARLLNLIIYDSHENFKTGKITYKDTLNYRNLHLLIALMNHYYQDTNKQEINSITSNLKTNQHLNLEQTKPRYVRTKRKNYVLNGQISFDI